MRCILDLDVPARSQRLECRLEDIEVRFETGEEHAAMDEVEWLPIQPRVFGVVDFEAAIRDDAV
jgi:hypothetical protein